MLGLLYRDVINLKQSVKSTIFSILMISAVAIYMDFGMIVVMVIPLMLSFISIGTMQLDASTRWGKLFKTFPLKESRLVLSKYIIYAVLMLLGLILGGFFGFLYMNLTDYALTNDHFTLWKGLALSIGMSCSFAAFFFPSAYFLRARKWKWLC